MTNADRIRQMTDEELVELVNSSVCHYVTNCLDNDCEECGRKWVMKEVSEDAGAQRPGVLRMRFVDIDKVKKNLDENKPDWTAEDYAVACEDAEFYSSMEDFIAEHDDEIEMMMFAPELVPDEPKWIPCSKRFPEDGEQVLIAHVSGAVYIANRDGKYWEEDSGEWYDGENVTHWMPLPESPESEVEK